MEEQELFARIERVRQEEPQLFFDRVASFSERWRLWKEVVHEARVGCLVKEKLEWVIGYLKDDFTVSFA